MPYKDKEKRRDYIRNYQRARRTGLLPPGKTPLPAPFRLETAKGILAELAEQIEAVKKDTEAGTLEKARTVGYLAGIALRAVETAGLEQRLEALEETINQRKVG